MTCPYCGDAAELVTGRDLYPHRPDLADKPFYRCVPCDARVGCHPGTTNPLGRMATAALRALRMRVHERFDPLWQSGAMTRHEAYAWLATELQMHVRGCHVSYFDEAQCHRAIEALDRLAQRAAG